MNEQRTFLVFGATGQTGQHFVDLVLEQGHRVRALVRNPAKLTFTHPDLAVHQGAVPDVPRLDELVQGVDFVICMLGDAALQQEHQINTAFVRQLIPAMRRQHVTRLLYQAGALSKPPHQQLPPLLQTIRHTARAYGGQHRDNEAVMRYLAEEASDIQWVVHRAGIGSDGPSQGVLHGSSNDFSVATFQDCAAHNFRALNDPAAIHTCNLSAYQKASGPSKLEVGSIL